MSTLEFRARGGGLPSSGDSARLMGQDFLAVGSVVINRSTELRFWLEGGGQESTGEAPRGWS